MDCKVPVVSPPANIRCPSGTGESIAAKSRWFLHRLISAVPPASKYRPVSTASPASKQSNAFSPSGEVAQFAQRDRDHGDVHRGRVLEFGQELLRAFDRALVARPRRADQRLGRCAIIKAVDRFAGDGALQAREVVEHGVAG